MVDIGFKTDKDGNIIVNPITKKPEVILHQRQDIKNNLLRIEAIFQLMGGEFDRVS